MNQGLPKGWSIEGLTIEGLSPEAFVIVAIATGLIAVAAIAILAITVWRSRHKVPAEDPAMVALRNAHAEAATRLEAMIGMLAKGQTQLAHTVNERLDSVSHRLGDSLEKTKQSTTENLQKLAERLAVIDRAQKNITDLAGQVTTLQGVLANKQTRGAFGQWRMEAIVQDGLPKGTYAFQHTLANKTRPDCCVFLPDRRPLVIDAKFPLEAFTAYRDAKTDEARKPAAARLRADVAKHVCAEIFDPRRDTRNRVYVCAFGIDLCRAA
jgi:DNA recombination protein RmuC